MDAAQKRELGTDMLSASDIGYWAARAQFNAAGSLVVRDADSGKTSVITPSRMVNVHTKHFLKGEPVKGVHPSNYAWITEETDYDAESTDWAVQVIMFGEVIYG